MSDLEASILAKYADKVSPEGDYARADSSGMASYDVPGWGE